MVLLFCLSLGLVYSLSSYSQKISAFPAYTPDRGDYFLVYRPTGVPASNLRFNVDQLLSEVDTNDVTGLLNFVENHSSNTGGSGDSTWLSAQAGNTVIDTLNINGYGNSSDGSNWEWQLGSSANYWNINRSDRIVSIESQVTTQPRNIFSIENSRVAYGLVQDTTGFHWEGDIPPESLMTDGSFVHKSYLIDKINASDTARVLINDMITIDTLGHIWQDELNTTSNTYIGAYAMDSYVGEGNNEGNTAVGFQTLMNTDDFGSWNTAVGANSGQNITTGSSNTFLGHSVGSAFTTQSNWVLIGTSGAGTVYGDTSNLPIAAYCGGIENKIKLNGRVKILNPHYTSVFWDSSRVVDLTVNTPTQITNTGKNLWPTTETEGFSESGDTIIFQYSGGFDIHFEYNASASVSANFSYYIKKKSGTTTTTVYKLYNLSNAVSTVARSMDVHLHLLKGDKIYFQVENVTNSNDVTIYGGSISIITNHLTI